MKFIELHRISKSYSLTMKMIKEGLSYYEGYEDPKFILSVDSIEEVHEEFNYENHQILSRNGCYVYTKNNEKISVVESYQWIMEQLMEVPFNPDKIATPRYNSKY